MTSEACGELERIFARCWLFLAHDSQIPKRITPHAETGEYEVVSAFLRYRTRLETDVNGIFF